MAEPQVTAISFGPKNTRGVCSVCGAQAYKGSATKCETHRKGGAAPKTVPPRVTSDTSTISPEEMAAVAGESKAPRVDVPNVGPTVATGDAKRDKIAGYKARILAEGNPELVKGFAQLCKPIPPENFYNVTAAGVVPTDMGAAVIISPFEAGILARAAVELEASPVVAMGTGAVAPVMPYLLGAAAIGIIGFHALTAMTVRQQLVDAFKAQMIAQANAGNAGATPMPQAQDGPSGLEDVAPEATVTPIRPPFTEQQLVEQATN